MLQPALPLTHVAGRPATCRRAPCDMIEEFEGKQLSGAFHSVTLLRCGICGMRLDAINGLRSFVFAYVVVQAQVGFGKADHRVAADADNRGASTISYNTDLPERDIH